MQIMSELKPGWTGRETLTQTIFCEFQSWTLTGLFTERIQQHTSAILMLYIQGTNMGVHLPEEYRHLFCTMSIYSQAYSFTSHTLIPSTVMIQVRQTDG